MAQTQRVGKTATTISSDSSANLIVTYHKTQVVRRQIDGAIVLNSGGWRTVTTKNRMNQTSNQYYLGYSVYQKSGEWFVNWRGEVLRFRDGITLR